MGNTIDIGLEDLPDNARVGIQFVGFILVATLACLFCCLLCKLCESRFCRQMCQTTEAPEQEQEIPVPGSPSYWNRMDMQQAGQLCLNCGSAKTDDVSRICVVVERPDDLSGIMKVPLLTATY